MSTSGRDTTRKIMYGAAVGSLGGFAVLAVLLTVGCAAAEPARPTQRPVSVAHRVVGCSKPAPTTAAGYAAMFARTDTAQWAGGDTAITVTLPGRRVWLFSDSLSRNRMVHSAAITQTGGCLRVSHRGAQLLPNFTGGWYWITAATRYGASSIRVKAETVRLTGSGPWDFATGRSRYAVVTVNAAGDASFSRWLPGTVTSDKPRGELARVGPGHVTYGQVVHHDIRLSNGRYLTTVCQNWDDGVLHPLRQYAPLFR